VRLNSYGGVRMATVLDTFDRWKSFLAESVKKAKANGMSDQIITTLAFQIGEFLDDKVDPKNGEERLLKELWSSGTEEERKVLASLMIKFVERQA
jgi:hypothetical protein